MKKLLFGLIVLFVAVIMAGGALACTPPPTPTPTATLPATPTAINTPTATPANTPTTPPYKPPKPIWLMMWTCADESPCFNIGIVPGPDGACFVYDLNGDIIPTSTAASLCSVSPSATMKLVYAGWVTLPYPGTHQVWGPNGEGDILLAKINKTHHWHLAFAWFFPGYGGH
jgi:hypothetical protein